MTRKRVTPAEAQADWARHEQHCETCRYWKPCEVGKKLHDIWYHIAALAMREIFM